MIKKGSKFSALAFGLLRLTLPLTLTVTPSSERVGKHHLEAIDTQVTALSRISTAVLTSQRDLCVAQSHDHNWSGQRSTLMDGAAREAALCQRARERELWEFPAVWQLF